MEEVEQNSASQEVATQQTEGHEAEVQQSVPQSISEDVQEKNWRAMREKQRQLEYELKMQREMNEKLMNLASHPSQHHQNTAQEPEEPDDDFIPKGKVKKVAQKEVEPLQKRLEELEKRLEQQKHLQNLDGLKRQFSDFDDIVNAETLALLEEKDPELAQTIVDLKDPYKIGLQSYKYIKAMNLSAKIPEQRRIKEVEKKLEQNAKTVQTPQAFEKRPLAQAFVLTDAEKSKLYEEMTMYARQAGSGW